MSVVLLHHPFAATLLLLFALYPLLLWSAHPRMAKITMEPNDSRVAVHYLNLRVKISVATGKFAAIIGTPEERL